MWSGGISLAENLSSYIKSEAILEKSKAHFRWLTILVTPNRPHPTHGAEGVVSAIT